MTMDAYGAPVSFFAKFDAYGFPISFYRSDVNPSIPGDAVAITPEDWQAHNPPIPSVPVVKTYKADLWRRATDEETDTILAALTQQSTRKQRIFADASFLDHADPDTQMFKAGLVMLFGQERADELLSPSE